MATFADGKIEAYIGPRELKAADDLEAVIVDFIAGARKSLDIAVQELDSEPIAQAILDARWRGVDVELFLEQDYLRSELKETPRIRRRRSRARQPSRRSFARSGSRTRPSLPRTAASSPRSCAPTSKSAATSTRRSSTKSSCSATTEGRRSRRPGS
jgi:phosphatidylserine/phosphatidylglycerophosphate/cardiolipin synthase-like enzyme